MRSQFSVVHQSNKTLCNLPSTIKDSEKLHKKHKEGGTFSVTRLEVILKEHTLKKNKETLVIIRHGIIFYGTHVKAFKAVKICQKFAGDKPIIGFKQRTFFSTVNFLPCQGHFSICRF